MTTAGARDPHALTSWHADWSGLRALVVGLGAAGFAAVDTLVELGADVLVVAEHATDDALRLVDVIGARAVVSALEPPPGAVAAFDAQLVVVSPGVAPDAPLLVAAREGGIPVWGDVELAWRVRDKVRAAEWLAVGGAGATLATDLLLHVLAANGVRVAVVGDDAPAVLDAVRDPGGFDALVVQLGERQLRHAADWPVSPLAGVVTAAGDAVPAVLGRLYANTRLACVYNKADLATQRMVEDAEVVEGARAVGFDAGTPGPSDLGVVDGIVVDRAFHDDRHRSALELTTRGELEAVGLGDGAGLTAVLAASALARAVGVPPGAIGAAIATFASRRE
ncbi:hypothetical protein QT381_08695 [Galbitalea sp. SE-J8]|uniref:hypothetical protein n=1 Tax=Galbitalea sp. SE-J8 TaxID=3054952 RepID=UPI00259D1C5C|nr:hypothetical protein [Galbitalea sp. SE-J8]MDM4763084.1 hypothetical protein [Galbitalea sp. SE-J8]